MFKANFQDETERQKKLEKRARIILGVDEGAGKDELKKAYWKLAMKYHPDRKGNTPGARKRFENIKAAYEFLVFGSIWKPAEEEADVLPKEENGKYNTKNSWGYFLWWRDKYF